MCLRASRFALLCLRQMYFHSVFPCHPDHSMSWVVFREPFLTFGIGPGCLALSLGMCVAGDYCLNESLSKRNKTVYFIVYLPETNSAFTRPSTFNFLKYCTCIDFTFHILPPPPIITLYYPFTPITSSIQT